MHVLWLVSATYYVYCYNARALRHARALSSYNAPGLRHHEEPARKSRCTSRFFVYCFAVVARLRRETS